mgnify:CR=1 FL=1|jgi:hypothetical protein
MKCSNCNKYEIKTRKLFSEGNRNRICEGCEELLFLSASANSLNIIEFQREILVQMSVQVLVPNRLKIMVVA